MEDLDKKPERTHVETFEQGRLKGLAEAKEDQDEKVRRLKEDLCGCGAFIWVAKNHWEKSLVCGEKGSLCPVCKKRLKVIIRRFGEGLV